MQKKFFWLFNFFPVKILEFIVIATLCCIYHWPVILYTVVYGAVVYT